MIYSLEKFVAFHDWFNTIPVSRRIFQPSPNNLNKPKRRRIIFRLVETLALQIFMISH